MHYNDSHIAKPLFYYEVRLLFLAKLEALRASSVFVELYCNIGYFER